jgi:hypothetical protein
LLEPDPVAPVCPGLVAERPGAVPGAGRRLVGGGVLAVEVGGAVADEWLEPVEVAVDVDE